MRISRERYGELFGATKGDRIRLGDTSIPSMNRVLLKIP
ncbi:MAG: hypothetical protein AAFV28_07290 [Cyanobacteria bacterium J06635_13]